MIGSKGALHFGDVAAQAVSHRFYGSVDAESDLDAITPKERVDGMGAFVMATKSLWVFDGDSTDAAATGSVRVPSTGDGRWHVGTAASATGAGGVDFKESVLCATTAALAANTRVGNVLTANANGALGAIDGVTPTAGKRILVKNEVTGANNGIYDVTSAGGGGAPWVLTRSPDADQSADVTPNLMVSVEQGTANGDKIFELDIDGPVTLNTTTLTFVDWRGIAITAPADVTKAAAAVGTSTTLARSDHKHDVSTAAAVALTVGGSNAEGNATSLARSNHTHSLPFQVGTATLVNGTVAGVSATLTASSQIKVSHRTLAGTEVGTLVAPSASRNVGASTFTIDSRKVDGSLADDDSLVEWEVIG